MSKIDHWYLHVDLDAFFASVEQLDHPEYKGKPVIVGGKPEDRRSVVSTASYEARKFGVHSAMPTYQAYKLCPQGIYVHGRMDRYSELSYQIMNIFRNYSPDVDQMSIDEAFIDITGTEKLFGPPLEVAKRIKAEVKQSTGLTVSVGIAPTKYLAKIASGFQKPDGITFIDQGQEESFMLDLPLNKVWGLGPKSLELIHSKGIRTTRDIYEMPLENLVFLFGKNMGNYLYEVVRGNEKETFTRETKNHSISAESTFPYDLTDVYAIETELLELAHGVFFRLLKHNSYSRTAFVKIRYDDFSTCSIQETLDRNIITLDTYFEIIKKLFERKYERGRGIRLLGVGFENVTTEEKPYQQDLFGNSDEKKQAVEKAILKLEKKHPEIKVRKARTFKSLLLFFLMLMIPVKAEAEAAEEEQEETFQYEISGFYSAEVKTGTLSSFGNGYPLTTSFVTPVFTQEVELTTSLLYLNHWYFQGDFADKFEKSTIAIGYKDGTYVKDAKISNRNITFPNGYSAETFGFSPKGGQNQAPGISVNLESPDGKWAADFLLRYDMTKIHSATFYGLNKVNDNYVSPANFVYGHIFTFPEEAKEKLSSITGIYVENSEGQFKDSQGKTYIKLSITDYTVINEKSTLLISSTAGGRKKDNCIPTIIVTFADSNTVNQIITETGDYTDSSTFAGNIQNTFGTKYDLRKYTYNLYKTIDNTAGLVIQNAYGFSPYLTTNVYDFGLSSTNDYSVLSKTNGTTFKEYRITSWDDIYNSVYEDFFNEKHYFAQVINEDFADTKYPFVKDCPEIYLNLQPEKDISILSRAYAPVKELSIGTKVSAGSLQVYRNGSLDNSAIYNSEKGTVTLSKPVTSTDKIYILWQEESNEIANGSITTAAGYKINFNKFLSADAAFSALVPISTFTPDSKPVTQDSIQNSYGALSAGVEFHNDNLKIAEKANIAVIKENAANKLLACSQENEIMSSSYLKSSSESNLSFSWDFTNPLTQQASFEIEFKNNSLLKNASSIELEIKPDIDSTEFNDYEVYLQIGTESWKLELNNNKNWQVPAILLKNEERAKLISNPKAYIVVKAAPGKVLTSSGSITIGKYKINTNSIFTKAPEEIIFSTKTELYNSDLYSTTLRWTIPAGINPATITDPYIYAIKNFDAADFSSYENINIDLSFNNIPDFEFFLQNQDKVALYFKLNNATTYSSSGGSFHTIKINTKTSEVFIDNKKLDSSNYTLSINKNVIPCTERIVIPVIQNGSYSIGNLYYSDTKLTATAKNYVSVDYEKDFSKFKLKTSLSSLQSTGALDNPELNVDSQGKADISSYYINAGTYVSMNNTLVSNGGHSLSTANPAFKIISLSEDYAYSKTDKSLSKTDTAGLELTNINIPLTLKYSTIGQDLYSSQNQKSTYDTISNIPIGNGSFGISLNGITSQKTNNKLTDTQDFNTDNYFIGWKDISKLQFSDGEQNALERQEQYNLKLSGIIPYGDLKPSLTYTLDGSYKNSTDTTYTDKEQLCLSVPFTISISNITFNISRNGSGIVNTKKGGNYGSDTNNLLSIQSKRNWFYSSIPFYELFTDSLNQQVTDNYSMKYEAVYKRTLFNSLKDLYIPSGASFAVTRDIKRNSSTKDMYQYKAVITNTSLNNFGSESINGTFEWFTQEEIISNLTAIVKVPVDSPENTSYKLSAQLQTMLFITETDNFTTVLDGSLETYLNWSAHGSFIYTRNSNTSLIYAFAKLLAPELDELNFVITRKDLVDVSLGRSNKINKRVYTYQHNVDHKFLEHYSVSTGLGGVFTYIDEKADNLELNIKLGVKIEF